MSESARSVRRSTQAELARVREQASREIRTLQENHRRDIARLQEERDRQLADYGRKLKECGSGFEYFYCFKKFYW